MKVLFLAPQPFYQERGTPIAVRLALEVLSKRKNDTFSLLTYHEGESVELPGVDFYRIPSLPLLSNIQPSISLKKIACDVLFFYSFLKLLFLNRKQQFDRIHAVEESVFMALFAKVCFGIPYIYDMDSSLSLQITEKWHWVKPLHPILSSLEGLAIKNALAALPVCDSLAEIAQAYGAKDIQIVRDISLLNMHTFERKQISDIRAEAQIASDSIVSMYVGNLEAYQGIDLLLEAFSLIAQNQPQAHCIIIGGNNEHIEKYREKSKVLNINTQVHFLGSKPVKHLKGYLAQANILLSPRTLGNNTPMKIYSYLHAKIPTLATRLPTHTQVLRDEIAALADPEPKQFSEKLLQLIQEPEYREQLAQAAFFEAEEKYTLTVFTDNLNALYDRLSRG